MLHPPPLPPPPPPQPPGFLSVLCPWVMLGYVITSHSYCKLSGPATTLNSGLFSGLQTLPHLVKKCSFVKFFQTLPHPTHTPFTILQTTIHTCAQLVHVNFQLKLIQLYSRTVTSLFCSSSLFSSSSSSCSLSLLFFKSTLRVCIPVHVR